MRGYESVGNPVFGAGSSENVLWPWGISRVAAVRQEWRHEETLNFELNETPRK